MRLLQSREEGARPFAPRSKRKVQLKQFACKRLADPGDQPLPLRSSQGDRWRSIYDVDEVPLLYLHLAQPTPAPPGRRVSPIELKHQPQKIRRRYVSFSRSTASNSVYASRFATMYDQAMTGLLGF